MKTSSVLSDSAYDSVNYAQVKTTWSKSKAEAEEVNQSQRVGTCIVVIGLSFRFYLRLRHSSFHQIVNGVGRIWKRSDSSISDSVALMTLTTTSIKPLSFFRTVIVFRPQAVVVMDHRQGAWNRTKMLVTHRQKVSREIHNTLRPAVAYTIIK